ncbi:MAG: hypothetical protein ABF296_00460 [Oceanococcaceae bacterium]
MSLPHDNARYGARFRVGVFLLLGALVACEGGRDGIVAGADAPLGPRNDVVVSGLLAAATKRSVVPTQSQVDGEMESRLGGLPTEQNFHLGGFGIGPLQNLPDPLNVDLTVPVGARVHVNAEGEEEPTMLRLMWLSDPQSATDVVLVSLDAVGAGNIIQSRLKQSIAAATGANPDNILFGQTHTHAGADLQGLWGGVPQSWVDDLMDKAAAAAVQAQAELRPVTLEYQRSELPEFNNYRRPRIFRDAEADTTASVLTARARDTGAVVATLLQYNAHPTSVGTGEDPRVPHPDFPLGATDALEARGGVALYFNGPIADASGAGGNCEGDVYVRVRCRGEALAGAALDAAPVPVAGALTVRHATAYLPVTNPVFLAAAALGSFNRYYNFTELPTDQLPLPETLLNSLPQLAPYAVTTVSRISIGDALEIVTIPGEAPNTFGEYIQALAGERDVMLFGLTHNSFGYIIPEEEFSYLDLTGETGFLLPFTNYEEYVSLGPLTAPLLRIQAYAPLFDAPLDRFAPPSLVACYDPTVGDRCVFEDVQGQLDYVQRGYHSRCVEAFGEDNAFCNLIDPG